MDGKVELPGSFRAEPLGAKYVGELDDGAVVSITVHLKNPASVVNAPGSAADFAELAKPITRQGLVNARAEEYAPAVAAFREFATRHGLTLGDVDPTRRCLRLLGSAAQMADVFGTRLRLYDDGRRRFHGRSGVLHIPEEIAPWTRAVLGLDCRPQVKRRLRNLAGAAAGPGMWPSEIAGLYGVPSGGSAAGQCVGVIALGGGYLETDLVAAADGANRPHPVVIDVPVDGVTNNFNGGDASDEELALDLQVVSAIAPGARIAVYFTANNIQNLAAALHQAVLDNVNRPQVISVSWGSAEEFWTDPAREAMHAALADAVRLKVTVVVAAGDFLATGGLMDGQAHVFFPASSPYVLSCGGTAPALDPAGSAIVGEVVWNDGDVGTGGGISDSFPVPDYQAHLALPPSVNDNAVRRGLPDVAGAAARNPGYRIVLNGAQIAKDGTSAAAPLWAALIALANAQRGTPVGLINPFLYANPGLCRPIIQGDNRTQGIGYNAGTGWNACTGLGVPKGADIVAALTAMV
jgi:kumamolisin